MDATQLSKDVIAITVNITENLSIEHDLSRYFVPYGTLGVINNLIGIYMWMRIMAGEAPLFPNRKIKHTNIVSLVGLAWIVTVVVFAIVQVRQMKTWRMKEITIGVTYAVVALTGGMIMLMRKEVKERKEKEQKERNDSEEHERSRARETPDNGDSTGGRQSTDSKRSLSSSSTLSIEDTSEKTGFLETFTNRLTSVHKTQTQTSSSNQTAGNANAEGGVSSSGDTSSGTNETPTEDPGQKKEETDLQACGGIALIFAILSPGHVLSFIGTVGIAKKILAPRPNADLGEQREVREVRDTFIFFGVVLGVVCIIVIPILVTLAGRSGASRDEEGANAEENKKRISAARVGIVVFLGVSTGLFSMWCQYFVVAAAARDTYGTVGLFEFGNLRLVYIILSKLLLFAC
ncbi:hypothetical protein Cob_v010379 [Colletotrichum orbiculare MAFF 240422]|uniref:Uncharacterized protein n=1 Tax=Colletotrichum orbiculare (strain 104-T / ATCC 96160 / CBS 514.97 / LARS 414 / MAFF 240422) TaxID=1213857 RepID=N4VQN8_COLOR|nr:hypothetical protein Cob_v010379 [Colletotrichum orbiculare MAFF 240422]